MSFSGRVGRWTPRSVSHRGLDLSGRIMEHPCLPLPLLDEGILRLWQCWLCSGGRRFKFPSPQGTSPQAPDCKGTQPSRDHACRGSREAPGPGHRAQSFNQLLSCFPPSLPSFFCHFSERYSCSLLCPLPPTAIRLGILPSFLEYSFIHSLAHEFLLNAHPVSDMVLDAEATAVNKSTSLGVGRWEHINSKSQTGA